MTFGTLAELKDNSIRVTSDTVAVWPQRNNEEELVLPSDFNPEALHARYCANRGVLAFVDGSGFYVAPYTTKAEGILGYNHFRYVDDLRVPFSEGDYPRDDYARWEELREKARKAIGEY